MTTALLGTGSPLASIARRVGSLWWLLVVAGVVWIVLGFVVLRFDGATVAIVAVVFGVLLLVAAGGEALRAVVTAGAWRGWHVVFAALLVVAAVVVFIHPGDAFVSLALTAGIYFVLAGTFDIVSSLFSSGAPGWWLQLLAGIAEVVLGFLASSSYASGVVVLVTAVSVVAVFRGVAEIAAGFTVRSLSTTAQ